MGVGDRLHQPLHFRIVPDAKGMIFERVQLGKIEIDNLLFHATGGIPRGGRLLGCSPGPSPWQERLSQQAVCFGTFYPEVAAWPCRRPPCQPWPKPAAPPQGALPPWAHSLPWGPPSWPGWTEPAPGEQLWQALLFPARVDCLPFQRREYSFYRQPPKKPPSL